VTVLKLVRYDDPILSTPSKRFDLDDPPVDPVRLAMDLVETMNAHGALGLSAPQVGIPYRVICFPSTPNVVMFNPVVVDSTTEETVMEEGCLTYPGLLLKMRRKRAIKVRYFRPNGEVMNEKFADMTARVIQHEVDHLDGRTILNVREGVERYTAQKKWSKIVARTGGGPASIKGEKQHE
jgi:peptide deformylase